MRLQSRLLSLGRRGLGTRRWKANGYRGCRVGGTRHKTCPIDDFRGRKSQIVQNGVLLRVDIHMLYDANLLGIEPGSHRIVLAGSADLAPYEYLSDAQLRVPRERRLWPDDELLEIHYRQFVAQQAVA